MTILHAPTEVDDPVVIVRNVTKHFGRADNLVLALDDVSIGIQRGSFTTIMGPSGSGKSTFMHCVAGLDTVTSGTIDIDGIRITNLSERKLTTIRRDHIGFVFQSFNLIPTLTAAENIMLPSDIAHKHVKKEHFDAVVDALDLSERLTHKPAELSGGQQQRVACARALVQQPAVLFADEPTGNLDSASTQQILQYLRRAVDDFGQTVVMVTHEPDAAAWADKVLFLKDGRLVAELGNPNRKKILQALDELEHISASNRSDEKEFGAEEAHRNDLVETQEQETQKQSLPQEAKQPVSQELEEPVLQELKQPVSPQEKPEEGNSQELLPERPILKRSMKRQAAGEKPGMQISKEPELQKQSDTTLVQAIVPQDTFKEVDFADSQQQDNEKESSEIQNAASSVDDHAWAKDEKTKAEEIEIDSDQAEELEKAPRLSSQNDVSTPDVEEDEHLNYSDLKVHFGPRHAIPKMYPPEGVAVLGRHYVDKFEADDKHSSKRMQSASSSTIAQVRPPQAKQTTEPRRSVSALSSQTNVKRAQESSLQIPTLSRSKVEAEEDRTQRFAPRRRRFRSDTSVDESVNENHNESR